MVQDARKFQYSSDYPQPIVTYRNDVTLTGHAGQDVELVTINHGLPYVPLLVGRISEYADFRTSQDVEMVGYDDRTYIELYADATKIYLLFVHLDKTAINRYVRLLGFVPPNYDGDITPIQNNSKFRFNTDDNYLGVYKQGTLTAGANTIAHNLGYAPQARAWALVRRHVNNTSIDFTAYSALSIKTNASNIVVGDSDTGTGYYHIYTAEA